MTFQSDPGDDIWFEIIFEVNEIGQEMIRLGLPGGTNGCLAVLAEGLHDQIRVVSPSAALQSMRLVKGRLLSAIERVAEEEPDHDVVREYELEELLFRMRAIQRRLRRELHWG